MRQGSIDCRELSQRTHHDLVGAERQHGGSGGTLLWNQYRKAPHVLPQQIHHAQRRLPVSTV
jgi:hypothetical protein